VQSKQQSTKRPAEPRPRKGAAVDNSVQHNVTTSMCVYMDVTDRDTGVKASKESAKQFVSSPNIERPDGLLGDLP
jgi:hypothetical protein